uniref:Islet amyloid polypeptide n=1 Tax=Microcebus murinus TaxID=30608 RepID=A0A8C5W7F4_MICMU
MCILKLPVFLLVLSVVLNHLKATPLESMIPVFSRNMLLELRGAKPEREAGKTKSHHRHATLLPVQYNAWQIF